LGGGDEQSYAHAKARIKKHNDPCVWKGRKGRTKQEFEKGQEKKKKALNSHKEGARENRGDREAGGGVSKVKNRGES